MRLSDASALPTATGSVASDSISMTGLSPRKSLRVNCSGIVMMNWTSPCAISLSASSREAGWAAMRKYPVFWSAAVRLRT